MQFVSIANTFSELEAVSSRIALREMLAELFKQLDETDTAIVSYLITGRLVPLFLPVEFNISDKILYKALQQAASIDEQQIQHLRKEHGDAGNVAESLRAQDKTAPKELTLQEVYDRLWQIALITGSGSVQKRVDEVSSLFKDLSPIEIRFACRLMIGKMRLGVSDKTIIDSLSVFKTGSTTDRKVLEAAYGQCSDIGLVASHYRAHGAEGLPSLGIVPGVPLAAKLVERESSFDKIWKRIPTPIVQPKYDGLRAQIHVYKPASLTRQAYTLVWTKYYQAWQAEEQPQAHSEYKVELFSRNLETLTPMFPEVVEEMQKMAKELSLENVILDSEVIGFNSATEEFLLFQDTMKRRRKHNIESSVSEFPIKVFTFDLLLLNGTSQLEIPLEQRLLNLQDLYGQYTHLRLAPTVGEQLWQNTPVIKPHSMEELTQYFQQEVSQGLEGVIVKEPTSIYDPGTRNFTWLKFKKAMDSQLADTVDVVILGYYQGQGRLLKLGIGALLTGIYDRENDRFLTISKLGTGVTYEQWAEIKKICDQYITDEMPNNLEIPAGLIPDTLLTPHIVIEVEADQVTKSPLHSSGYALRFPRFKKFREKKAEDCTSLVEVKELTALSGGV